MRVGITTNISLKSITFCQYQLKVANKDIRLSFPQILDLRNKVHDLTFHDSLEEIIEGENFVLLFVADRQHLVFLEIHDLIQLKERIDDLFYSFNPVLI